MSEDDGTPDAGREPEPDSGKPSVDRPRPAISLKSLSPHFDPEQHQVYVDALEQGLRTPGVRNIALTGPYGTGKSSVLAELSDRHPDRVIELSLSSVGEESVTTDEKTDPTTTVTNRIQKEIVKQILYRDPPARTRGSRFRRLAPLRFGHELPIALAGGLLLLGLLFITKASQPLIAVGDDKPVPLTVAYLMLWLILTGAWLLVRYATYGRLSLEKLTAGPATVSLTGQPTSYFDQYIDEIVFSFEQTGRDVVIFEDLDRFRDVHIFESLRALNTLLNSAAQVRQRRRQERPPRWKGRRQRSTPPPAPWPRDVVFIYALRDSVFERLGGAGEGTSPKKDDETTSNPPPSAAAPTDAAEQEVQLANRTKFFDLVVPVVPFITHRNARELMKTQMEGTDVGLPLIALAAQHVAEQRLIIDLRNEFDIYADRLLHVKTPMPGLDADKLFAMLLYKSVHLADFEQIRFRRSRLDQLWDAWRELVAPSIDVATEQDLTAAAALTRERTAVAHARMLADRVDELAYALLGVQTRGSYSVQTPAGYTGSDELRSPAFWKQLAETRQPLGLYAGGRSTSWPYDALPAVLDRALRPELWLSTHQEAQQQRRASAQSNLRFLAHHTWTQIHDRADFRLTRENGDAETFRQLTGRLLQSRLAQELVAAGYIDEYFALWISMFYGRVASAAALDFMVHVLDHGTARIDYPLSPTDVDMVLADREIAILGDRAAYNVAVLDRLLETGNTGVELMLRRVLQWEDDDVRFVTRYLQRGTDPEGLLRRLAPRMRGMAPFALAAASLERRSNLVDTALATSAESQFQPGDELSEYVLEHYPDFPSLTRRDWPATRATAIDRIVSDGLTLPDVTMLTPTVLQRLAQSGGYLATEANLQAVSGSTAIALDALRREAPPVADLAATQLETYLGAVEVSGGRQVTVRDPAAFVVTLAFVAEATEEDPLVERAVRLASSDCRLDQLTLAPRAAWRELLTSARTPPTAGNLSEWVASVGPLDPVQGAISGINGLAGAAQLDQSLRADLALALLATSLPVQQRVALVETLQLEDWLPTDRIEGEPGPLAGLLLRGEVVDDEEETFRRLVVDWPGRESAIAASERFGSFVSPTVLPVAEIAAFFSSDQVQDPVKQQVLDEIDTWLVSRVPAAADAAADWALQVGAKPAFKVLQTLAASGAQRLLVVRLLAAEPAMPEAEFRAVLRSMGGDYATVADPGRKSPSFPADDAHRVVLERLREVGLIGKIKPVDGRLRVWSRPSTD